MSNLSNGFQVAARSLLAEAAATDQSLAQLLADGIETAASVTTPSAQAAAEIMLDLMSPAEASNCTSHRASRSSRAEDRSSAPVTDSEPESVSLHRIATDSAGSGVDADTEAHTASRAADSASTSADESSPSPKLKLPAVVNDISLHSVRPSPELIASAVAPESSSEEPHVHAPRHAITKSGPGWRKSRSWSATKSYSASPRKTRGSRAFDAVTASHGRSCSDPVHLVSKRPHDSATPQTSAQLSASRRFRRSRMSQTPIPSLEVTAAAASIDVPLQRSVSGPSDQALEAARNPDSGSDADTEEHNKVTSVAIGSLVARVNKLRAAWTASDFDDAKAPGASLNTQQQQTALEATGRALVLPVTPLARSGGHRRLPGSQSLQVIVSQELRAPGGKRSQPSPARQHQPRHRAAQCSLEDAEQGGTVLSRGHADVRWHRGRVIGAGSFGKVYLALELNSGAYIAVKEFKFHVPRRLLAQRAELHAHGTQPCASDSDCCGKSEAETGWNGDAGTGAQRQELDRRSESLVCIVMPVAARSRYKLPNLHAAF